MPLFKYRAVDAEGNSLDGTMEGPFAHQVVVALQQQGLAVNTVRRVDRETPAVKSKPLSWHDLAQLNSQLLMATRSWLPLAPSIGAMAEDLGNPRIKVVLDDVKRHLEAGNSLQSALERHPGAFNPVYRALVVAGERGGNLPRVFKTLATYSNSMIEVRNNFHVALAYPLMVLAFGTLLMGGMLLKVVPLFADVFSDFGARLPAPTQLLLDMSSAFNNHFWIVLAILAGLSAGTFFLFRKGSSEDSSYWLDWLRLKMPVGGRMYMLTSVMQFSRALALLLEAHVPLLESLELAGASTGNAVLHRRIRHAARDVNAGLPLSQALQKTRLFDGGAMWLISNAEKNGNLEEVLEVLAEEGSRTLAYLYRSFSVVLGPALVISLGLAVAFMLVALYLPIFTLGDMLSGS